MSGTSGLVVKGRVSSVRPLQRDDLPAVARLYADFVDWPGEELAGFVDFFSGTLIDGPFADPDVPALVFEDPDDGVVAFLGSNPRPFVFGDRPVRLAGSGPLVVGASHRRQGIGAALKRRYGEAPADVTVNDRVADRVHHAWVAQGAMTNAATSIGWVRVLAPAGIAADRASRRLTGGRLPARWPARQIDRLAGRRFEVRPSSGTAEPLEPAAMVDLIASLAEQFPLRPAYDEESLAWLFGALEVVDPNLGRPVLKLVKADDGRPLGAYVMYVRKGRAAQVLQVPAAPADAGVVLDHLLADAAAHGAIEVRGRVETHLLPHLRTRKVVLVNEEWTILKTDDPVLATALLSGKALVTRLEGEWWMRPWPDPTAERRSS